jgi:prepilin-type N-terminal cleavage/methylation domain-containing protein
MRSTLVRYAKSQGGFTLVELLVASTIGLFVLGGLTSVVLTTWRAGTIATNRIEASGQIRNFQLEAYDDFALSDASSLGSCSKASPCTTQPIVLTGTHVDNSGQPTPGYKVTYTWDGSNFLDRRVATTGTTAHAATNVSGFFWYLEGSQLHQTVVVTLIVTMQPNTLTTYTETQTMRFYPRVNP